MMFPLTAPKARNGRTRACGVKSPVPQRPLAERSLKGEDVGYRRRRLAVMWFLPTVVLVRLLSGCGTAFCFARTMRGARWPQYKDRGPRKT